MHGGPYHGDPVEAVSQAWAFCVSVPGCPLAPFPSPNSQESDLKNLALTAVALSALTVSLPAAADLALATKSACTACHAVDKKLVGPAYQDVAKKYAGNNDAAKALVESIKKGGSGKWGQVPMPAQPNLSDADVAKLAAWILAGAK